MAKEKAQKCSETLNRSLRNPNLLSHYHECASRVLHNDGRSNEYLHNLFLKAAKNGELDRIKNFLKRSSINNNINVDFKDTKTGNTAIILAAKGNHVEIVKLLLNYGADITLHNEEGHSVVELATQSVLPVLLASVNRQGVSHRHLLQAAWQGNVDVLKRLLSSQADLNVNCQNSDGMTPLLLVTRDINLFERIERVVTERGYNPLEVMKELLEHNADPNLASTDGRNVLHYIASNKGKTAEQMANVVMEGPESCIDQADEYNCLPIHVASREDNCPVLLALIDNGADVNAKGFNGQTPLHLTAAHGHQSSSSLLITNGADITIVDDYGHSPVEVTTNKKLHRILKNAWVEQTRDVTSTKQRRSFSAPTQHKMATIEETQEACFSPTKDKTNSPRKNKPVKCLGNNGQLGQPSSTQKTLVRSKSLNMKPSPPHTKRKDTSRPSTRQISSRSHESANHGEDRFELPKLSVKNIELQYSSFQQQDYSLYSNIHRVRLLTPGPPRSLPGKPNTFGSYRSCSKKRLDFTVQTTKRSKIPLRIAPLPGNRTTTPELSLSPISVQSGMDSIAYNGRIVDLDSLQKKSYNLSSLSKLTISTYSSADTSLLQPPSSPSEKQHMDTTETLNEQTTHNKMEMNVNKDDLHLTSFSVDASHNENENENVDETRIIMEVAHTENVDGKESDVMGKDNQQMIQDNEATYQTHTFSSSQIKSFWIPNNKNDDNETHKITEQKQIVDSNSNKQNNEKDSQDKTDNRERTSSTSSVCFYVDMNDVNTSAQCASCTNSQSDSANIKSHTCTKSENSLQSCPQRKTFWISLDGRTSDGEAESPTAAKKIRYPHGDKCHPTNKSKRKSRSLPATAQPQLPFHVCFNKEDNKTSQDSGNNNSIIQDKNGGVYNNENLSQDNNSNNCISTDTNVKLSETTVVTTNTGCSEISLHSEGTFVKETESGSNEYCSGDLVLHSEGTFVKEIETANNESSELVLHSEGTFVKEIDDNTVKLPSEGTLVIDSQDEDNCGKDEQECSYVQSHNKAGDDLLEENQLHNEQNDNDKETASLCCDGKSESDDTLKKETCDSDVTNATVSSQSQSTSGSQSQVSSNSQSQATAASQLQVLSDSQSQATASLGVDQAGPKTAWSQYGGVQICNAFPSPVPPCDAKPHVQPAIGDKLLTRKSCCGKKGRKAPESKKDRCTPSKNNKKETTKKGKKRNKKKSQSFKEITVNQSNADAAYMTGPGPESCDQSMEAPSPDVDNSPTISIDSKTLSCRLMKKMFPVLSPIPESPYSNQSTPRFIDINYTNNTITTMHPDENSKDKADNNTYSSDIATNCDTIHSHDTSTGENVNDSNDVNSDHHGNFVSGDSEGFDEVDGGFMSRLFGACIPSLNVTNNDSSDEDLIQNYKSDDNKDHDGDDDDDEEEEMEAMMKGQMQSKGSVSNDEANDDVEDMLQEILRNTNDIVVHPSPRQSENKTIQPNGESDFDYDDDGDVFNDTIKKLEPNNAAADDTKPRTKQCMKNVKKQWTLKYINQMSQARSQSSELDDVFHEEDQCESTVLLNNNCVFPSNNGALPGNNDTYPSNSDVFPVSNDNDVLMADELSDNDSSYISCESTPRGVSDCSTFESNDSVLSPHGTCGTITHEENSSVDIKDYEHFHKTSNSSSSDSRSTLSNNSVISTQSFFAVNSRAFVRSQVSVGSISSATSCGEEIQWQKGSILGKGGFGTVYLGLVNTGEMIAVKQVELSHGDDSEAEKQYEKLQEEVSLLKSLRHENIVKYIGTCLDENFVVNIFMEYVPGGSVAQALKRFGPFVEPVFCRYTKQILRGVEYLHVNNVMHRDIKGGNIMLMPNGVIKLIDFGCAKRLCMNLSLSRSSMLNSIKGTPYWMAPEVIKETGAGTKSDIWSIGCTVFEMATGSPPWSDMQPMAAIFSIGNGSNLPQLGESFSQLARDFTAACMIREPEARPSATDLLKHAFINRVL